MRDVGKQIYFAEARASNAETWTKTIELKTKSSVVWAKLRGLAAQLQVLSSKMIDHGIYEREGVLRRVTCSGELLPANDVALMYPPSYGGVLLNFCRFLVPRGQLPKWEDEMSGGSVLR
ncbi:hypothetical protein R1flu_025268 [Riccia fluitans]|uniref:Uncharacterized protein n=1 Tax=Riccia fluitans TaxID=41844 RepID=A0ABD1Y080_9MARC